LTELLFALGAGDAVVGVTRYCTEPAERVGALAKVGGTKTPNLREILDLAPDLVIMNAEENRREDFDALQNAGVPLFVSEPKTVADGIALIARLGAAVGEAERGRTLADEQAAGVAAVRAGVAHAARPPIRYFCPIWRRPWMTFNADTYAHDVLRVAGGENVAADRPERYPEVDLVAVAAREPAIVLLPDEPYPFRERDLPALAPLADTPALAAGRVHLVDGKALAWYGPRIAAGVALFAELFAARAAAASSDDARRSRA
jgi:ABC-type Fe3+-hydroxamate transport system substrate-binding protein